MPILTDKKSWSRPRKMRRSGLDLSAEEKANVRSALRVLRQRYGTWEGLAAQLGVKPNAIRWQGTKAGSTSAGAAIHAARLAGVSVEELLSGSWPKPGACPHCGRSGEES